MRTIHSQGISRLYIIVTLLLAAALAHGCAKTPPKFSEDAQFSATLKENHEDGSVEYRVNVSGGMIRIDVVSPGSGVVIVRKDLGVIWTLMPRAKMYLEMPIKPENKIPLLFMPDSVPEYDELGEESLDGRMVLKERMSILEEGDSPKEFYRWFDPLLGWPVKAEDIAGKWVMVLDDIKAGPQDPSLFEAPEGYRMIIGRKAPMHTGKQGG